MDTRYLQITNYPSPLPDHPAIIEAAEVIRAGGLVAFPTETVYGLGANALDAQAVGKIYEAKQRALNDPLIVHVATPAADPLVGLEPVWHTEAHLSGLGMSARRFIAGLRADDIIGELNEKQCELIGTLIEKLWPGPLTLVLPRGDRIPPIVSAGLDTVAIRMPDHPVAQALIRRSGVPIAAPSANRFGHVSPTTAQHVLDDLNGRIDLVLDGGSTRIGVESTVLDLTIDPPRILRPGGVTRDALALEIRDWTLEICDQSPISNLQSPPSPGMLDKHYAPRAKLIVCRDTDAMLTRHSELSTRNLKVGLLILDSQRAACENKHPQFVLGSTINDIARNLYAGLRALDSAGVDVMLITEVERTGLGEAVADRLKRAAAR